ncbi:MAG: DUF6600 domain-containing protein [Terracidiphilus sp.]
MNRIGWVGCRSGAWALGLVALAVGAVLLAPGLRADDNTQAARAARLSNVDGQVRVTQGNEVLADPALKNTPLFEGTQVLTSENGRAELEFDDGSVVRLSPSSSLALTVLHGQGANYEAEIVLQSGLGYFELHSEGAAGQVRVRLGDSVVTAGGFTVLRIDLDTPPGELAVFSGNAHVLRGSSESGSGLALDLHGGESVTLDAADPTQYTLSESIESNSWDAWNSDRDQALTAEESARTGAANSLPNNNNPAWNDLDANGSWYDVPDQGFVWSPYGATSAAWDPYGNGYWMWTPRFGYIWVSGDSWGYMPFQCGAWNFYGGFGWGWAPGMCSPWWGGGVWAPNIGRAPTGYRPPVRPRPVPREPIARPLNGGTAALPAHALVPVNRRPPNGAVGRPVMRDRSVPATIAGHVVQPMRAYAARPQYQPPVTEAKPPSESATGKTPASKTPNAGTQAGQGPLGARSNNRGSYTSTPASRPAGGGQHAPPPSHPSSGGSAPPPSSGGGTNHH